MSILNKIIKFVRSTENNQKVIEENNVVVNVEHVTMEFKITKDKIDTLKEYIIRTNEDINMYLPSSYSNELVYRYEGINTIDRTIPYNSKLGEIKVFHGSDVIYSEDVYLDKPVKYSNRKAEMSVLIFTALTFGFFDVLLIIRKHYE